VSESLVDEAVSLGFTSVMFDGSKLDDETTRPSPAPLWAAATRRE